jgi:hypothetical protein
VSAAVTKRKRKIMNPIRILLTHFIAFDFAMVILRILLFLRDL